MAPILATESPEPVEDRLATERWIRAQIRRIYDAVLADRWNVVLALYLEAELAGDYHAIGVWAGLPSTVKERIREQR